MSGWIKIQRGLMDHWCSSDPNFLAVWIRLLSEANFKDRTSLINGHTCLVKRGQLIFGLDAFSKRSKVSVSKLRRIISLLVKENMIDRQKTNKYSIISIVKYNDYQVSDRQNAGKRQSNDNQTTVLEEGKEGKEEKVPPKKSKNKSKLPDGWLPSDDLISDIALKEKTSPEWVRGQIEPFKDYWIGEGAGKVDWDRTFRSRCRNDYNNKPVNMTNGSTEKWDIRLLGFINNNLWHESFGPEPTTDGKPDGPLNPECGAGIEKLREIFKRGPLK